MPALTSVDADPSVEARRQAARRARHEARVVVRRETNLKSGREYRDRNGNVRQSSRLHSCGRNAAANANGIDLRFAEGQGAGIAGLQSCGSVWACPVCAEKINAERQHELEAGISAWLAQPGRSILFGTATIRHHKGQRLAPMWDAISPAWNRTTSGAGVAWNGSKRPGGDRGDKAEFGIAGYVRLVEVKHGDHGWHPHAHFLLFLERELADFELAALRSRMFGRWQKAVRDKGFDVLDTVRNPRTGELEHVGMDLRRVWNADRIADYFAKNGYNPSEVSAAAAAAYEVTGSQSKKLGKGGVTPFQLLERIVSLGDADDLDLWHEWEAASQGRRQLTWSRGLRQLLELEAERTDEEIAEDELEAEPIVRFEPWAWLEGRWYDRTADLLEAAEAGVAQLLELLEGVEGLVWYRRSSVGLSPPG